MKATCRLSLFLLLCIATVLTAGAQKKSSVVSRTKSTVVSAGAKAPDFAYPKTVIQNAEQALKKAYAGGDDEAAVRALMDFGQAQCAITVDNRPKVLAAFRQGRDRMKSAVAKSLMNLLIADVYNNAYGDQRWKYDQRQLPLLPLADDFAEWSGQQMQYKIRQLLDSALVDPVALQSKAITDYNSIITCDPESRVYYPTVYDFVAMRVIAMSSDEFDRVIPRSLMMPLPEFLRQNIRVAASPRIQFVLCLYGDLLRFHEGAAAPTVNYNLMRLAYTEARLAQTNDPSQQYNEYNMLKAFYDRWSDSQYCGDILLKLPTDTPERRKQVYSLLKTFELRFPSYNRMGCIRNAILQLKTVSANLQCPSSLLPGGSLKISLKGENFNKAKVDIYRINGTKVNFDNTVNLSTASKELVKSLTVNIPGVVPFSVDTIVETTLPVAGHYVAVISNPEGQRQNYNVQTINVADMALGYFGVGGSGSLFVVDGRNGRPIDGAKLHGQLYNRNSKTVTENLGLSDREGLFASGKINDNYRLYATKGDRLTPGFRIGGFYNDDNDIWHRRGRLFTDLSFYRPGDTVRWNAVCYETRGNDHRLLADTRLRAVVFNTNHIACDTLDLTSDAFGRISGQFATRKDELTGNWSISVYTLGSDKKNSDDWVCNGQFMVSDYKLPSFFIQLDPAAKSVPAEGDVTLSGRVQTYSGMAVADARTVVTLSASARWYWCRSNDIKFFADTVTTDTEGRFRLVVPAEILDGSPYPDGSFTASVQTTDVAGESQQATLGFYRGNSYSLNLSFGGAVDASRPVIPKVLAVLGPDGKPVVRQVVLEVNTPQGKQVGRLTFSSSAKTFDFSSIPSGQYNLKAYLADEKCDTVNLAGCIVYRPDDRRSPVDDAVWSPDENRQLTADARRRADILYATAADDSYLLLTVAANDKMIRRQWIHADHAGFHRLTVELPEDVQTASVRLSGVKDMKSSQVDVRIISAPAAETIRIKAESFRDRIVPGTQERWTFRVVSSADSTRGVASAMILDMYNKAIDALAPADWSFHAPGYVFPYVVTNYGCGNGSFYANVYGNTTYNGCPDIQIPSFNFYGYRSPFSAYSGLRIRGTRMNKQAAVNSLAMDRGDGIVLEESAVVADAANGMFATAPEAAKDEVVEVAEDAEQDNAKTAQDSKPVIEYRDSETPLAFYMPDLETDADGNLSVTFRVPNANTTWRFNAVAFTRDLLTDLFQADVMANKPVMVNPNLPRFVRIGDRLSVSSTVANNSDSTLDISTLVEVFNPSTGAVLDSVSKSQRIEAGRTDVVTVSFEVPSMPFIGLRVRSSSDRFGDGEQSLIPVLPATTPVIETQPFYISPDSTEFSMRIKEQGSDARVTLQFCDNPTWYVVTALPGLREGKISTPQAAALTIFSAAVADGLLRENPAIADALRDWSQSDRSDSTLVSMLQRNADLKTLLLQATPWMMDAANDTERMERLQLLFDPQNVRSSYAKAMSALRKLWRQDRGWAWIEQINEPSQWATYTTLSLLGRLSQLGYMPKIDGLPGMIEKALQWNQSETVENYRRYPKGSYADFMILRDLWSQYPMSTSGQAIFNKELQKLVRDWRQQRVEGKALSVGILYRHGYKSLAASVCNSLLQFAEQSPEKGMWFPSLSDRYSDAMAQLYATAYALRAVHQIDPQSKDIDRIRQWLILQKEALNWGDSNAATEVVASILSTSKKWLQPAGKVEVTVGGRPVDTTPTESRLGYFRRDISGMNPSGAELKVVKSDLTPAWGAVYSQSTKVMDRVEASSCDAVSIEKRLYRQVGTGWEEASDVKVGDRLKVQLLIKVDRQMQYVAITDDRAAGLEPVEQLPEPIWSEGLCFYRENLDSSTRMFVTNLPRGTYLLEYQLWANNPGTFSSGIATLQSQYAPQLTAHSAGSLLSIRP